MRDDPDARYRIIAGLTLLAGILAPFLGYAWLVGGHAAADEDLPASVMVLIPFMLLGDDYPSIWEILLAFCGSGLLWAALTYGLLSLVWRVRPPGVNS